MTGSDDTLATSTYEVLRKRLRSAADDLRLRFDRLNAQRAEVFGNLETRLLSTVHVTTEHNCVPRDLLSVNGDVLLGFNVQFGLKSEVAPSDVFSLYRLDGQQAVQQPLQAWIDERFHRDFADLYRYYKNTAFSCFFHSGPFHYMVFQVGKTPQDIKAFKWVAEEGRLRYLDNRSDHEVRYPEQHGFRWTRATRDMHRSGTHPHVSIGDILFVECIGGDLTIKIEDNTASGSGIYSEAVDNIDQTLDDAEIHFCILGSLVLLKIRPYLEKEFRFFVYSTKSRQAMRLDAMRQSCAQLPEDHGIIFPGGVYLQSGSYKLFDHGLVDMLYQRTLPAPNGEDFLYQFYQPTTGTYLHLRYNLIRQQVDTPLVCHGQAFFDDGRMITMRVHEAAQKHHALQLWQTPFVGPDYRATVVTDSMLYKIGNRELVQCMAECQEILQLVDKEQSYADLYVDLVKRTTDVLDGYFWLDRDETQRLSEPLMVIRQTATAAVDEYEKVVRVRNQTAAQLAKTHSDVEQLVRAAERQRFDSLQALVSMLHALRTERGHVIGLRELRTIDLEVVEKLESQLLETTARVGGRCVQFLLDPQALESYRQQITATEAKILQVKTVAAGRQLEAEFATIAANLELLIETISTLQIEDLTQRTAIVDRTGDQLALLNRARSVLKAHVRSLLGGELEAEFASQMKLIDQAAAGGLDAADSAEKVDEALTRFMLQLEELEGRFAEHEGLLERLHEKREALVSAFEARRVQLVEARSRRADGLVKAADRILIGLAKRAERIDDADELRATLSADPMVDKVRRIADQLRGLGDTVRTEDVLGRLKALADDALRGQRDRQELFVDGQNLIRLGEFVFSVHRHPIELTTIVRDDRLMLHMTGTQFFQPLGERRADGSLLVPAELLEARDLWSQSLPSESEQVYRGELLAFDILQRWRRGQDVSAWSSDRYMAATTDDRVVWLRGWMQEHPQSAFVRGVHDADGAAILNELIRMEQSLGLLRFSPRVRGLAWYAWQHFVPEQARVGAESWIRSYALLKQTLKRGETQAVMPSVGQPSETSAYRRHITDLLRVHAGSEFWRGTRVQTCAQYLLEELFQQACLPEPVSHLRVPAVSAIGVRWLKAFLTQKQAASLDTLCLSVSAHAGSASQLWQLGKSLVDQQLTNHPFESENDLEPASDYRDEFVRLAIDALLNRQCAERAIGLESVAGRAASSAVRVAGLHGDHPRIEGGVMPLRYHEFIERLTNYTRRIMPRFQALQSKKRELLHAAESRLRAGEFKAKVLTSFVRNRLIDEVFLPRIGANLAKQLGTAGENKRSDRSGLLLLVSPPGYGKTTLMEYVANRLGLVLVKVNGPAIGHQVRSLDPSEATSASAREEVQRINLALEMGDNVMLYLDDIQHCHTELLQKFIPLCDATRRIEGVWEGQAKTYDLRGRKVAVVMAGNPYTESGQRFQIPDMLANRADVYNLGEIIGGAREAFEQSYLENCLASNPVLMPLARGPREDQLAFIRAAERGGAETLDLVGNYTPDQRTEMLSVLRKLVSVRDIVLKVNRLYIQSAAQADAYRTEPPFKLQGSYRNMNRIAEKISPVMNDQELLQLVVAAYEQDAQTLTRDGESNLLRFRELAGVMTDAQRQRWQEICYAYVENVRLGSMAGDDQALQVLKSMAAIRDGLEMIRREIHAAVQRSDEDGSAARIQAQGVCDGLQELSVRMGHLGEGLIEQLQRTGQTLEQNSQRLPEQKVIVQHSVPRSMSDLVRSQYQLLYDGLKHLLEQSHQQTGAMDRLQRALSDVLAHYASLQVEIESAERYDGSADPSPQA